MICIMFVYLYFLYLHEPPNNHKIYISFYPYFYIFNALLQLHYIYRPFARRLPEFKFWYSCIKSVLIATVMTLFSIFDVPVFWPILVLYFFILFYITMKRQISHMIKHKYVPWNFGKTTYNNAGKLSKDGK